MIITEVNETALIAASEAVVGPEATQTIMRVYAAIKEMGDGYYALGKEDGETNLQECCNTTFDHGYSTGCEGALSAYEHGYATGKRDGAAESVRGKAGVEPW